MLPADAHELMKRSATFAHLEAVTRETLGRELVWFGLPGGRPLFKCGEPANAQYLLRSGSLGVFDTPITLRHLISAGENAGEISLLGGAPRQRTVRHGAIATCCDSIAQGSSACLLGIPRP
jgi:NTE family protein